MGTLKLQPAVRLLWSAQCHPHNTNEQLMYTLWTPITTEQQAWHG